MEQLRTELSPEEQLAVRNVETVELRAANNVHEFRMTVEYQMRQLQERQAAASQATVQCIQAIAEKHELDVDKMNFNFEKLVFVPKS